VVRLGPMPAGVSPPPPGAIPPVDSPGARGRGSDGVGVGAPRGRGGDAEFCPPHPRPILPPRGQAPGPYAALRPEGEGGGVPPEDFRIPESTAHPRPEGDLPLSRLQEIRSPFATVLFCTNHLGFLSPIELTEWWCFKWWCGSMVVFHPSKNTPNTIPPSMYMSHPLHFRG